MIYYVVSAGLSMNTFEIASTIGGSAINTTTAGSGTFTGKIACGDYNTDGSVRTAPTTSFNGTPAYLTGQIQWVNGQSFTYGTVTIIGTLPAENSATWPSWWFLKTNCQNLNIFTATTAVGGCPGYDATGYQEIDMVECWNGNYCQSALHTATKDQATNYTTSGGVLHTWKMIWDTSGTRYYLDGTLKLTITGNDASAPMFMIITTQTCQSSGCSVDGAPNNANLPTTLVTSSITITQP
jgi:hypothetical protein